MLRAVFPQLQIGTNALISLHNVAAAGQAVHYFSADNYYTERDGLDRSEWFGAGAKELGFSGKIERAQFEEALNGRFQGQELGKIVRNEKTGEPERDHRPGLDITFSAPKSVSILSEVYGASEVRHAHEGAVKAALAYVERELSVTRQMVGGELKEVATGNLAVALFRHNTSRDLDPQTHTHAVVLNGTKREDGAWRSLSNDGIYGAQKLVGAIYNSELAERLQRAGYEISPTDDKGNFEIAGISREQIEHFSQRRAEMEAAMEARGLDIHSASSAQKEMAALATRARKVDVDHGALLADWKERAADVGLDLAAISERAKSERAAGVEIKGAMTGQDAIKFAVGHLIEREAVIQKRDVLEVAVTHGIGRVSVNSIDEAFKQFERSGDLVPLPGGGYTTSKMLGSERWTLAQLSVTRGSSGRVLSEQEVQERIAAIEKRQGFGYTVGQKEAITLAMTSNDRFVAVQGLAGAGKTTMMSGVREMAEVQGYVVRGMAPTAVAAKKLGSEIGLKAETVHMFLIQERLAQKEMAAAAKENPDFVRPKQLWIVDESSFLSQRQMQVVMSVANKSEAKVVFIGDKLQLTGVEAGKPFEMAQSHGIARAEMTEISRQKTAQLKGIVDVIVGRDQLKPGERLTNVELKNNRRAFEAMDKQGLVREVKGDVVERLVADLAAMGQAERARTIVITPYNADRLKINDGVRGLMRAAGELAGPDQSRQILESKGWTKAKMREAQYYKEGDVVRFGRDYVAMEAKKGEYMRVAGVDARSGVVTLRKDGGGQVEWEPCIFQS